MTSDPSDFVEVGEVPQEILQAVNAMKSREAALLMELGRMEARKADLLAEVKHLEKQAQGLLQSEADRLGIAKGAAWKLTPEGKALSAPAATA